MREEACEALQVVQRLLESLRQRLERVLWQVAVLSLNRAKLVDNDRPVLSRTSAPSRLPLFAATSWMGDDTPPVFGVSTAFCPHRGLPTGLPGPERFLLRKAALDHNIRSLYGSVALAFMIPLR